MIYLYKTQKNSLTIMIIKVRLHIEPLSYELRKRSHKHGKNVEKHV